MELYRREKLKGEEKEGATVVEVGPWLSQARVANDVNFEQLNFRK